MFHRASQSMRRFAVRTVVSSALAVGALEVTTHLPTQGRSSEFYHKLIDQWVTPAMRRFLDPEVAHQVAVSLTKKGFAPYYHPSAAEQRISVQTTVFDERFPNPIGLAAGFDKDGEIIQPMLDLGFGFVEIGTVTPQPQPGNPKPRMFRLVQDLAIVNRYGFNSKGTAVVKQNLEAFRQAPAKQEDSSSSPPWNWFRTLWYTLYPEKHATGIVGVNIGKNATSQDEEAVVADYVYNIVQLGPLADYLVINISSPNTTGLRNWQQAQALEQLLRQCQAARDALERPVPLLVKLAPDLNDQELEEIAVTLLAIGIDGIVVTNTSTQRPKDLISHHASETGGLSGAPVKDPSTECIRRLFALTDGKIPIIGVGGVGSGHDAYVKFKAGASLVQVYSMMVYEGPGVVSKIRNELAQLMLENGQRSIEDVVGLDHEEIFWRKREQRLLTQRRKTNVIVVD